MRLLFRDLDSDECLAGLAGAAGVALGDSVEHVHALDHLTKHGVMVVQVRCGDVGDEELAAIRVRAGIGHRQDAGAAVAQGGMEFIGKLIAGAAHAGAGRVAALDHERLDDAVEGGVVVEAIARQEDEVVHGLGGLISEELDDDVALAGLEACLVLFLGVNHHFWWILILFSHRPHCNLG